MKLSKTVEDLKKKKRELEVALGRLIEQSFQAELKSMGPSQRRLRVCETCGAQLNILDHESRLTDHYRGKMHLGMVEIREKYEKLKVKGLFYAG